MTDTNGEDIVVEIAPEAPVEATPVPAAAEAPPAPAVAPAAAAPAAPVSDDPQVGIDDLKRQLADERARADRETAARQEAERRAQSANGEAQRAFTAAQQAEFDSIVNALGAAEGESKRLEAEATAALEAGEFAKATDLHKQLGKVAARIDRLEEGKAAYESRRGSPDKTPPTQPARVTADWNKAWNTDETESFLQGRTARTAAWIRQHPQFASDPAFRNKVAGADGYVANVLGVPRDTDQFFAKVEEIVGLRTPAERKDPVSTAATPVSPPAGPPPAAAAPRAPTPAAPPTPSVPSSRPGANSRVVTLTPEEAAHARATLTPDIIGKDKDPLVVFARNKAQLIAEGKWHGLPR